MLLLLMAETGTPIQIICQKTLQSEFKELTAETKQSNIFVYLMMVDTLYLTMKGGNGMD